MACLKYETHNNGFAYEHKCVPILLGSWLDYLIRGHDAVKNCRAQWCQVILRGIPKLYMSFSTFDALSMHVRLSSNCKSIEWFFYVNGEGVELSYYNQKVTTVYQRNIMTNDRDPYLWIELVDRANPFRTLINVEQLPTAGDYLKMFDIILQYPYDMNDLKNRQFISVVGIFNKIVDYILTRKRKRDKKLTKKISSYFEEGNFFMILSKKNAYDGADWNKSYPQTYDSALQYGRSNKTAHFLPTVTRATNVSFRNSSALMYPDDGFQFLCMVNTKDIKAAGEQNVLADFVMMSEETNEMDAFATIQTICDECQRTDAAENINNIFIINGFLVGLSCNWTFERLLRLKRTHMHITTKLYWPYVYIFTKASIPIKFSDIYNVYFSPNEVKEYFDNGDERQYPFQDDAQFSLTAKTLDRWALMKNPPAKTTVAINNIKGSVANITSNFHKQLIASSQGITCYIEIDDQLRATILNSGVLRHDAAPNRVHFNEIDEFARTTRPNWGTQTNYREALQSLMSMYDVRNLKFVCVETRKRNAQPEGLRYYSEQLHDPAKKWGNMIFSKFAYDTPSPWNLRAWIAFGNYHGACIEDGVVLDKKFVSLLPPVVYNACISVDFTFNRVKCASINAIFIPVNDRPNSTDSLIGCVITNCIVFVKHSRHCTILVTQIGNHYYHLIHFMPKEQSLYQDLSVSYVQNSKMLTVLIKGVYKANIVIGSKIANSFGQKNVVAAIEDLSHMTGVTRDGRLVHAQVLYNKVSIIGRMQMGLIGAMTESPDLALGPNKELFAPTDLVIHTIHPYTNTKLFKIKIDTLVNANGFDAQALSSTTLAMRTRPVIKDVLRVIGMHGFRLEDSSSRNAIMQ